jgi:hypothetical protein
MKRHTTVVCLSIITVIELIVRKEISGSAFLWVAYGFYKLLG